MTIKNSEIIKFSVVIPVYNASLYLEKMLLSLSNQTLNEIEIICVNDGSTDDSRQILTRFQEEDGRIKILEQEHKGAAAARNLGLTIAVGEYVIFLDADDFFDITLLEKVYKKGKSVCADAVLFGAKRYDDRTGEISNAPRYLWKKLIPDLEVFSRKDMNGELFGLTTPPPWTKAFRREYILEEDIWFQDLPNSNDVRFVLTALAAAERITIVAEDLVYYRVFRKGSLQNRKHENPLCFLSAYEATYDELNRRGIYKDVERGFCSMVLSGCVYNLNSVLEESAKWEIIRALCSDRFERMHLMDFPEDYYDMPEYYNQIKGLPYALEMRDRLNETEERVKDNEFFVRKKGTYAGEKKVTVIISVFNLELYIKECLDSIVAQTLKEIEIICIDDGSKDSSLEILLQYAEKDERITVCEQKNSGLSMVRNKGVELASGEYVYFLDGDDALEVKALENLYAKSKRLDLDVLYFNGETIYEDEQASLKHPEFSGYYMHKGKYPDVCSGIDMFVRMRSINEYRTNVGIQFFRRQYLIDSKIRFLPGILHEDNDFSLLIMLLAEKAGFCEEIYFKRRVRGDSIMTSRKKFAHVYGYFRAFLHLQSYLSEYEFPEEITELLNGLLTGILGSAREQYNRLAEEERFAVQGLYGMEKVMFQILVSNEANNYEKIQKAYREKREINEKLQQTYKEKSEINRKLQITYREKYDRGVEIKRLKSKLEKIKKSKSYRLARMIGYPVCLMRKLKYKIQGMGENNG